MFKKVLIAEDMDGINKGVYTTLSELKINTIEQTKYCDDAYLKFKKAMLEGKPYNLLISDLSFIKDHREQKFGSGEELIAALKKEHPELKVIVYSIETKLQRVRTLFEKHQIDAYVCKGRESLKELVKAIRKVHSGRNYLSAEVSSALNSTRVLEIDDFDVKLLEFLSRGFMQEEIACHLRNKNIKPNSLSSIEKRLSRLRDHLQATNVTHLVANAKDLGLI